MKTNKTNKELHGLHVLKNAQAVEYSPEMIAYITALVELSQSHSFNILHFESSPVGVTAKIEIIQLTYTFRYFENALKDLGAFISYDYNTQVHTVTRIF